MQGCSCKLHFLFHGLRGNTCENFTPVITLKYYGTLRALSVKPAEKNEVNINNAKRAADCSEKVVVARY